LDFAAANQWRPSYFYRNESADAGAFLGLRLRLPAAGGAAGPTRVCRGVSAPGLATRPAVGAQVSLAVGGGRLLVAQVDGGNGHSGKRSPDVHFGLGRHPPAREWAVELRWRDSEGRPRRQRLRLPGDGWYTVVLGREEAAINECE